MIKTKILDPLLECLLLILKQQRCSISREALLSGLPLVDNRLTPSLFVRAAERGGMAVRYIKRPLAKISPLLLPAVILLRGNTAAILQCIRPDGHVELIFPENPTQVVTQSIREISAHYTGYALLAQPAQMGRTKVEASELRKGSYWFWRILWKYHSNYYQVLVAAFFINVFTVVSPLFIMNVYDRVVPNNAMVTLWVLAVGVLIIFVFDLILRLLRAYIIDACGKKADTLLAANIFQHIMNIELGCKPASVGVFINQVREFDTVRDFFTSSSVTTLVDLPFVILFVILIWYLGGPIVFISLVFMPLLIVITWLLEIPMRRYIQQSVRDSAEKNAVLVEALSGLDIVKSLVAEGIMQGKWERLVASVARASLKGRAISSLINSFSYFFQQIVVVGIVIVGVYLIEQNSLTLGGLIACTILAGRAIGPLNQVISLITRYQQAKIALHSLNKIMAMPTEQDRADQFLSKAHFNGDIVFNDVTFDYTQGDKSALTHISFHIKPGERVAIVGKIGSGKTTIQKLLLGLYYPKEGQILIDNLDLQQINPVDLRKHIGYVPQDTSLFRGTIKDNIALGHLDADDDAIIRAAEAAGVDRFVKLHPLGYSMLIGDRGEGLSGGQKQAVAIARALVGSPEILLFDEPTSSMDEASARDILQKMMEITRGKTLILATHKANLLKLVDRVIVVEHGKIILDGPKDKVFAPQPSEESKSVGLGPVGERKTVVHSLKNNVKGHWS